MIRNRFRIVVLQVAVVAEIERRARMHKIAHEEVEIQIPRLRERGVKRVYNLPVVLNDGAS